MAKTPCIYCDYFPSLKIVKKRNEKPYIRRCNIAKRKVTSERQRDCAYFTATTHPFYCDNNNCQLDLINCIARRRNRLELTAWDNCRKCRQWDTGLREVVERYFLDMARPKQPIPDKPKRKIKRRVKRTIKRRDKSPLTKALEVLLPEKRSIKRREVKRKIKRRQ